MRAGRNRVSCGAHSRMRLLALFGAAGLIACDGVTEPASRGIAVSLSVGSITLAPGNRRQVVVTVAPQAEGVRLSVTGLAAGMGAILSPEYLPQGVTQSKLTVSTDSVTPAGDVTLTVSAVRGAENISGLIQAKAALHVSVTAGGGGDCPGYALPSNCPPFPTGGSNFITGVVRERSAAGTSPIGGATVWAWVQYPDHGYSAGGVQTDASGKYRFPNLPDALIVMEAGGGGYDHPCASVFQLGSPSVTEDLELVSDAHPIFDPDPAPPALTGVVYENVAGGRQPVAGARVFFETLFEIVAATTTTDEHGRYSLCRLPSWNSFVTPVKAGYITSSREVSVSGVMEMDIEMTRQ